MSRDPALLKSAEHQKSNNVGYWNVVIPLDYILSFIHTLTLAPSHAEASSGCVFKMQAHIEKDSLQSESEGDKS